MTERVKDELNLKFFRSLWHDWFGHPIEDLIFQNDFRKLTNGEVWYRCRSCGMSVRRFEPVREEESRERRIAS